jgi:TusA-related sulfurtransferase
MSLYMDVHNSLPGGTTAADLAGAHAADLQLQQRFGVRYLHYWVDAEAGKVFCLVEAPTADAAYAVHREAHGLVADEIYPVVQGVSHMLNAQRQEPRGASSTKPREAGEAFVAALARRNFGALRSLLAQDLRFRVLLPSGPATDHGADAAVNRIRSWFGDAHAIDPEASSAVELAGRVAVTYRFRVHRTDGWDVIEQHAMLDLGDDTQVTGIDLLCSGFRRLASEEPNGLHEYDAGDLGCADGLAGEFRRQMQKIPVGHVLVVRTSDPAAKEDLPSLARLMGHVVRSIEAPGNGRLLVSVERGR